ncbi:MAG: nucleotidyltransferase family protein [Spirochaetaceae bacterium]|nr:nucleotidyltransferase family protein [Spirochaetaceae bacterium]
MSARASARSRDIAAVVLAAGSSSRLGTPKQLLRYRGETLLHRTVRVALAAGLDPVHVVLGCSAPVVGAALEDLGSRVTTVFNRDWQTGMGSSLARGIASLPGAGPHACREPGADVPVASELGAALVLVTDQPHVSQALLAEIAAAFRTGGAPLVASRYAGGALGVPALFARRYFPELTRLTGDRGARALFTRHRDDLLTVAFPEGDLDIDTPAAAAALDSE